MASAGLDSTIGVLFIGTSISIFFQGILTMQAYVYYDTFPCDPWYFKALVAFVWSSDMTHQCLVLYGVYFYAVTSWGTTVNLSYIPPPFGWHVFVVGLTTFACHAFFVRRIYIIGQNKFILTLLSVFALAHLSIETYLSVAAGKHLRIDSFPDYGTVVLFMLVLNACLDTVMALLLIYYIRKGRSGLRKSSSVINKVIQYTVATGFLTSLLAFASVIANLTDAESFIYMAIHINLPRAYSNALFASLNQRKKYREELAAQPWDIDIRITDLSISIHEDGVTYLDEGDNRELYTERTKPPVEP